MKKTLVAAVALVSFMLYGCPPGYVRPKPGPAHVPPGQIKRQHTPSGAKPIPPGQMKKHAPRPSAPVAVVPVPPLPPVVIFDVDPFYYHEDHYYFYDGSIWWYSDTKTGPRKKLPKTHYPKEVRHKGKGKGKKKGR